jgi:hypothetical protein
MPERARGSRAYSGVIRLEEEKKRPGWSLAFPGGEEEAGLE